MAAPTNRDHVITIRGVLITALGAVVAAVIGLGSALITSDEQEEQKLRADRGTIYAQFLGRAHGTWMAMHDVGTSVSEDEVRLAEDSLGRVYEDFALLELIGSKDAAAQAVLIVDALNGMKSTMNYLYCTENIQPIQALCSESADKAPGLVSETYWTEVRQGYRAAVRTDLGID